MNILRMSLKHSVALTAGNVMRRVSPPRNTFTDGPIRLYWWNLRVNFGDVLSPEIVKYVSGRDVTWASIEDCDMISTGSLYGWLRINAKRYQRDVHIWGSGIKKPVEAVGMLDHLHHHLVRGPLTAVAAENDQLPMGDPGLLSDRAFGIQQASDAKGIGVIPHRSEWSREDYIAQLGALPGVRLINFRSDDCKDCISQIAACESIYSSSLHGLIVADALGIKNHWFQGNRFEGSGHDYKYFDYALSVGRNLQEPVDIEDHIAAGAHATPRQFDYFDRLEDIKDGIEASFPYHTFGGTPPQER